MLAAPCLPNESRRLRRLAAMDLMDTGPEKALDAFTALAAEVTGMRIALISLVDQDRQWFKSAVGLPQGAQTTREVSFCGHALAHDGIFEVEDAPNDRRFFDNPLVTGDPHVVHYAGVPLQMPDGERIGTLCVIDGKPGKLQAHERAFLAGMGRALVQSLLLRESERSLRRDELLGFTESLSEFCPAGLFALDDTGSVVHANERWLRLLGLHDLADALGWGWTEVVDPQALPTLLAGWTEAVRHRRAFETEVRTRGAPQKARWVRLRLEPSDRSTSAASFIGVVADVTETRQLQEELLQRNEVLETVVANLPCGLAVLDSQLNLIASNERLSELLQLPPHLLAAGTSFAALSEFQALRGEFGAGDARELAQRRVEVAGSARGLQEKHKRPNGTVLDVRSGRMPGGGQVQVYTDITAEKQAARALRIADQRLAIALEAAGLGQWEYEPHLDTVHLSESWSRLFGFTPTARNVSLAQMAELVPPGTSDEFRQALVQLLKGETPLVRLEHEMRNARGETIWVVTRAQVTERGADGRALRLVGSTKDVSLRRTRQAELNDAVAAANEANRAKADFLATMSHEIRTPINGVIGLARMLEDARLPEAERGYVKMINSCASTLLSLVNDVLDFSKIEAGQMVLECIDTDLHALVEEAADVLRLRAEGKGVSFSVHLDPQVPRRIRTDSNRLRQILLNLLGNALKFTSSGGFSLRASVPAGQVLRFDVTDTGIGIAGDAQARLFNRFAQAEAGTARQYQGSGLGLAISRDLARLMGGDITLQSTLGVGSTFSLTIPLQELAAAAASPVLPAAAPAPAAAAAILLVEDNAINQLVARTLLAKIGLKDITIAGDGRQALEACRQRHYDLVLMDCHMPVMDGFEATRALRASGFERPIIALTAGAVARDREACMAAGMDGYLAKPIDAAVLAGTVQRALAAGTRRRDLVA